ncbi:MAG TPA: methyltransferase [Candidatus Thermoplasmatota archaeon]|jgi:SAM-dependent methyltransferase|nr:methyltransferase [Candidatus Thermoplasmatota archaeon]
MPAPPSALERLAFATNAAPGLFLDLVGTGGLRAAHAGLKLGIFEALRDSPRSGEELAAALKLEPRALGAVLELLAATGYLQQAAGRYGNTALTTKWLLRGSPQNIGALVSFWQEIVFPFWDQHLLSTVREGAPPMTLYQWMDQHPGQWPIAQAWFRDAARLVAAEVVAKVPLDGSARRLLDVGGGHGEFSAAFCRAHAGLQATILDQPAALALTRDTLRAAGMEARITLQEGDFERGKLGVGYDAVLLFNVLHGLGPAQCQELLRKASEALITGGRVAILDNFRGRALGPATAAFVPLLGVVYLVALGGRVHDDDDVAAWLRDAGFEGVQRKELRNAPGTSVVLARKAG